MGKEPLKLKLAGKKWNGEIGERKSMTRAKRNGEEEAKLRGGIGNYRRGRRGRDLGFPAGDDCKLHVAFSPTLGHFCLFLLFSLYSTLVISFYLPLCHQRFRVQLLLQY